MQRTQPSTGRRLRQAGQSMVETALVLTTVVAMIIFIMDMGRMLLTQQYLVDRARLGARNAAVNNWTATQVQNFVCYNSTTAPQGGGAGLLGLSPSQVSYQTLGSTSTGDYRVQVKITGVSMLTWIPYMSGTYTSQPVVATMVAGSLGSTN